MTRTLTMTTAFLLATLAWAVAQQSPGMGQSGRQPAQGSQMPGQQPTTPGVPGQTAPQTGAEGAIPGQAASGTVTEGCLGGSNPNFTITDTAGKTYKLNIPQGADANVLTPHVGESVQVMGDVKQAGSSTGSIDVTRVGKGTSKCPGSSAQPTSKQ